MARPQLTDEQIEKRYFKKTPTEQTVPSAQDDGVEQENLSDALAQMRADKTATALAVTQQNERVASLARELNYQGSTDQGALENSARDAIKRIGMGVFELGGYLLMLREGCVHGQFLPTLERLNLAPRAAQQYMGVAKRFANAKSIAHLMDTGIAKLVELIALDDGQLDELADMGQTGELALDDVASMSVKELRLAVRKERAEAAKQKSQVERLTSVNTELHEEARLVKRLPTDAALKKIKAESMDIQAETIGLVRGGLRQALGRLNDAPDDASKEAFMAGLLGAVYMELDALRDEFNLPLAVADATPEWERWVQAQANGKPATDDKAGD